MVAAGDPPLEVAAEHIADVVSGGAPLPLLPAVVIAEIGGRPGIAEIRPVAFGIYAVAGSMNAEDLLRLPGIATVATDQGLQAATADPYFPTQWSLDNGVLRTTTPAPTSSTTLPVATTSPTTTIPPTLDQFDDWRDSLRRTPEGLNLVPPAPDDLITTIGLDVWVGHLCDQPLCPGWVLEQ